MIKAPEQLGKLDFASGQLWSADHWVWGRHMRDISPCVKHILIVKQTQYFGIQAVRNDNICKWRYGQHSQFVHLQNNIENMKKFSKVNLHYHCDQDTIAWWLIECSRMRRVSDAGDVIRVRTEIRLTGARHRTTGGTADAGACTGGLGLICITLSVVTLSGAHFRRVWGASSIF